MKFIFEGQSFDLEKINEMVSRLIPLVKDYQSKEIYIFKENPIEAMALTLACFAVEKVPILNSFRDDFKERARPQELQSIDDSSAAELVRSNGKSTMQMQCATARECAGKSATKTLAVGEQVRKFAAKTRSATALGVDNKVLIQGKTGAGINYFKFLQNGNLKLCFASSGSTGIPLVHEKKLSNLLAEIEIHKKTFEVEKEILSFVKPVHIYGFLFSFLLPYFLNKDVRFLNPTADLDSLENHDPSMIVMVPSVWPLVKRLVLKPKFIVSSGAKFTEDEEFLKSGSKTLFFEILGSTETGGLGIRKLGEPKFKKMGPVEIFKIENDFYVKSPFVFGEKPFKLADQLELEGEYFSHKGRSDRIFKWGGKRYSLTEVESALEDIISFPAKCFFKESNHPKGGVLMAAIESSDLKVFEWRQAYFKKYSLPFPEVFKNLERFPKNEMGKLKLKDLEKIF